MHHPAEDTVSDSYFSKKGFVSCFDRRTLQILKRHFEPQVYIQLTDTFQEEKYLLRYQNCKRKAKG